VEQHHSLLDEQTDMEEKEASAKISEDPEHAVKVTPASLAPPQLEPQRQNTQGLRGIIARTLSRSNQADEIRRDSIPEFPEVPPKRQSTDQRVGTHLMCGVEE
jgi:hypothetical protein